MAVRPDSGPWPPLRGFTITLRHTAFGRTPLDERSARIRDLYLTKHTTHKRQTSITLARYKLAIPVSERPQTHALDSAITRIGHIVINAFYDSSSVWLGNFQDNKFKQVIIPSFQVIIHLFMRLKFNILSKNRGFVVSTY